MFCELDMAVLRCSGASAKEREIIPPILDWSFSVMKCHLGSDFVRLITASVVASLCSLLSATTASMVPFLELFRAVGCWVLTCW